MKEQLIIFLFIEISQSCTKLTQEPHVVRDHFCGHPYNIQLMINYHW